MFGPAPEIQTIKRYLIRVVILIILITNIPIWR